MASLMPVVFLPGLLCDGALWAKSIEALQDRIEPFVPRLTEYDTIGYLAAHVLREAPPQFSLAALSMGGYVAFEIMRQAPERVLRLCLFNTSARADTPEQVERRRSLLALSKQGAFKGVTPQLLPLLVHPQHLEDTGIMATILAMAMRVGREAFQRQQNAILNRIDSRPTLPRIACPTRVVAGQEDMLTPPDIMHEIAHGIPGSKFTTLKQCGHLAPLEQPEICVELMQRWLES